MKLAIGLLLAVCVGIGCRWFGIPLPGPPAIMGAAMAVAMAVGYTATDAVLRRKSNAAPPPATVATDQSNLTLQAAADARVSDVAE
jgi:XapX domain-containing protein